MSISVSTSSPAITKYITDFFNIYEILLTKRVMSGMEEGYFSFKIFGVPFIFNLFPVVEKIEDFMDCSVDIFIYAGIHKLESGSYFWSAISHQSFIGDTNFINLYQKFMDNHRCYDGTAVNDNEISDHDLFALMLEFIGVEKFAIERWGVEYRRVLGYN